MNAYLMSAGPSQAIQSLKQSPPFMAGGYSPFNAPNISSLFEVLEHVFGAEGQALLEGFDNHIFLAGVGTGAFV